MVIRFGPAPGGSATISAPTRRIDRPARLHSSLCAVAVLSAALLLLSACSDTPQSASELHYGLTLAPTGIDPHLNSSVELGIPLSSVYDTLVFLDPESGEFVPGLATQWDISPDGQTYTFRLRDDVSFHDGQPFDAAAVVANIDYVTDPDHHSQKAAAMLGPLERIEALDEYTVVFQLQRPFAPLLDSLSQVYLGMASPAALESWGPGDYQFHQVGSGPYRFVEYLPNQRLTLERNPDYAWGPSIYRSDQAAIDRIVFEFFEDPATRAVALESGRVEIIGELPAHEAERFAASGQFELQTVTIPGQPLQYLFNTQLAPTDDPLVREALVLSVDRRQVVETVFGKYSPVATGPLTSVSFGYAADAALPSYDPAAATERLVRAGWSRAHEQDRWIKQGRPMRLRLVVPNWGSNPEVAQLVASYWEQLGAEVELEVMLGFGPLTQAQATGDYHAIGFYNFGSDPDLLRPFFSLDGFFNWGGYDDPQLDRLLEQAAAQHASRGERAELYRTAIQRINSQFLILPIRDYVNLMGVSQRVDGLRFSAQGWFPYLIDLSLQP